jgi:WhiB family redox-sensing transcriptional regulator
MDRQVRTMHPYLLHEIARQREENMRPAARHYGPGGRDDALHHRPGRRRRGGCVAGQPTAPEMSVKMRKLTAAASVSLGTVAPPSPWAGPSGNGQSRDNGCLPAAGLAARPPVARPRHDLPCTADPELFFAESPDEAEAAKALCGQCPARAVCLAGALERREPWGVWGGEVFLRGAIVPRKRPRGRPRKTDVAA